MDEKIEKAEGLGQTPLSRRTVAKGIAWSVPAVMVLGATPAFAASAVTINAVSGCINSSNKDSLTLSGTGPVGKTVTISHDGTGSLNPATPTTTVGNDGKWSVTFNPSGLSDGSITFTAATAGASTTITKDTVAPALTSSDGPGGPQTGHIIGERGQATGDGSLSASAKNTSNGNSVATFTYAWDYASSASGPWSTPNTGKYYRLTWTWTGTSNAKGNTITISQSDTCGNTTTVSSHGKIS